MLPTVASSSLAGSHPALTIRFGLPCRVGPAVCLAAAFAIAFCCPTLALAGTAKIQTASSSTGAVADSPILDRGFHYLYELNFDGARGEFLSFERQHPADPLGRAAEAASYLYEEFNAKGIFTSQFFLNDAKLLNGADGTAAENRNDPFLRANAESRQLARNILRTQPRDAGALLALTLADGMESDYDALIVKKHAASLGLMRQAEREANALLAVDPNQDDAFVALGASDYVIGCLPGYKRAVLWLGGIHGDRARGMDELQRAADNGHYLRPFAQILLALACEREHQPERARQLLSQLTSEFPANKRFARELALVRAHPARD